VQAVSKPIKVLAEAGVVSQSKDAQGGRRATSKPRSST